jgi:repressor LexA
MTTSDRIRKLREERGLSQETLAAMVGYTNRSSIAKVEKGKVDLSETKLAAFAKALNVTPAFLLGVDESSPSITDSFVSFPVMGEVAAGYDHYAVQDWTEGNIDIPASWLHGRPREDFFVLRVCGQSMFPTYQDGDIVLVLKQATMDHSGQIGVVIYDDDKATLKRVEYVMGEDWMKLSPVNPQFPPIMVTGERLEHCRVLGIPKMVIRKVN